jgi:O-antigen/teichoic acid export membrane protein
MTMTRESLLRWSYFCTFATAGMQLLAAILITRFLQPKDYGLAAMAMLCSGLTSYFTQLGMDRAIIQKTEITTGNIRAAFTLSVATGFSGFIVLAALSPLLAIYFKEPRLPGVVIAFALNLVFQSISMVAGGLLRREFRIRRLAICDVSAYLLSTFGLGLPMAIKGYGVWALVASNVSQPLIVAIAYFIARPHPILPTLRRDDYRHITGFGGKVSLTTLVEALSGSLDTLILGRLVTVGSLGLYNRSITLSQQPIYALSSGLSRVFHPSIARAADRTLEDCKLLLENSQRQLMAIIIPTCIGAAVAAPTIIPVVLGRQWAGAIPVYQALCIDAALDATFHLPSIQLEVLGRFRNKLIVQLLYGLTLGISVAIAARFGIVAVAWVHPILQFVRTICLHALSARSLRTTLNSLIAAWRPGMICGVVVGILIYFTQSLLSHTGASTHALQLLLMVALSTVASVAVYRIFYRGSVYGPWVSVFRLKSAPAPADLLSVQ